MYAFNASCQMFWYLIPLHLQWAQIELAWHSAPQVRSSTSVHLPQMANDPDDALDGSKSRAKLLSCQRFECSTMHVMRQLESRSIPW